MKEQASLRHGPNHSALPSFVLGSLMALLTLASQVGCEGTTPDATPSSATTGESTTNTSTTEDEAQADGEASSGDTPEQPCDDPVVDTGDDGQEERIGFEIIEVVAENDQRAWISPVITYSEFEALDLPEGWLKNQPRESVECGADDVRFIKSPEGTEEGDIAIEQHFGHTWFHAATVTQTDVALDEAGLLFGAYVKKYHELIYNPGSCMVLLVSPEGDVYFRMGRDATRTCNTPTLPQGWELVNHTVTETLTLQLFDESLVIRTDNQDSFQGPIPQLRHAF